MCDIDVGNARPIAQRVRKVAPQFWEKLADLIVQDHSALHFTVGQPDSQYSQEEWLEHSTVYRLRTDE